ncbi:MAG TPA: hypothetical protein VHR66_05020 [Gemmataceae bacterium]|jgi:ABC-type cobalamin/Fe3+-siderophores transport system ATPase subunit|nr:hypothetical protein [Gemmataceae bacterium]
MIVSIQPKHPAPYPGLPPFQQNQADIFFGREEQVDRILQKLADNQFLALVGASGSGKSSLAYAGMIAALEAGYMAGGDRWRIADMKPRDQPLTNLATALLRTSRSPVYDNADAVSWALSTLEVSPLGLIELLRKTSLAKEAAILPPGERLLILVDQFEELFRYRDEVDPASRRMA